ncbi:MAG: tetratricopeptide repeat protein [Verrucomicrobia bacterium]|nr:tetratricopeptide repeat protein [Verrucomicrobiota bacterium]
MRTPHSRKWSCAWIVFLVLVACLPLRAWGARNAEAARKSKQAREAYDKGQVAEAIALYTEAISIDPQYADAYFERSKLYRENEQWDKELEDLNGTLAVDAKHLAALRRRAEWYFYGRKYLDAELDYSAAIKIDRHSWYDYYMRGRARAEQGHLEAALKDFDDAIEAHGKSYAPFFERGKVCARLGKMRQAEKDLERSIELSGEQAWPHLELGKLRLAEQKHDEALKLFTAADRLAKEEYGEPLFWRGATYTALKDWTRAVAEYTAALARKYDTAELRYKRAEAYYELTEFEKARDDLKAALEKEPDNKQFKWALGQVESAIARAIEAQHQAQEEARKQQSGSESGDEGDANTGDEFVNPL